MATNPKETEWNNNTFVYRRNLDQDAAFSGTFVERTVTYPKLAKIRDTVMLTWRSGGQGQGRTNLAVFDTNNQTWTIRKEITSEKGSFREGSYTSDSRGPYTAEFHLDEQENLHFAWLWREKSGTVANVKYRNHGLYYAWSKDLGATWLDTNGNSIGSVLNVNNTPTVWDIPMVLDPQNTSITARIVPETQEFEVSLEQERSLSDAKRVNMLYTRNSDGTWTRKEGAGTPGGIGVPLPEDGPIGPAQLWDYSRLYTTGVVSVAWQREPATPGMATPLIVIDYQFAQ